MFGAYAGALIDYGPRGFSGSSVAQQAGNGERGREREPLLANKQGSHPSGVHGFMVSLQMRQSMVIIIYV
ncbi:hypothetical protein Tdes44962_MAKER01200 [Teratosphaeria destructans]|uniref:Uncharacterized protein n=1 Tax=Teratosphaeria destructans TaxID=418781 RepID=A0A9W7T372_9PEZI|nr:hypothetical protein Tdes44962_MAKER01200 [Teratosphaeria destructans]